MTARKLKIVFAGTPAFGLPCLEAIEASTHELAAVFTQADRPKGRGLQTAYSPVKEWALSHQKPLYQPLNFKNAETVAMLADLKADLMVVIAYGIILPQVVLSTPAAGCINVHASLLPRWRGASPIQQAILEGDDQSGITIMQMDAGMDTGDILKEVPCLLSATETAETLHDKLSKLSVQPLLAVIEAIATGNLHPAVQNHAMATYTRKIKKEQAQIDWTKEAAVLDRQIRAYNPWPVAFTQWGEHVLRIHEASIEELPARVKPGTVISIDREGIVVATADKALRIKRLQFAGGKILSVSEWAHSSKAMGLLQTAFQ